MEEGSVEQGGGSSSRQAPSAISVGANGLSKRVEGVQDVINTNHASVGRGENDALEASRQVQADAVEAWGLLGYVRQPSFASS